MNTENFGTGISLIMIVFAVIASITSLTGYQFLLNYGELFDGYTVRTIITFFHGCKSCDCIYSPKFLERKTKVTY